MTTDLQSIQKQVETLTKELLSLCPLRPGQILVLGCSSSEICGGAIGTASSQETGAAVIEAILPIIRERGLFLAVQGCEHINRSLVIEREAAEKFGLEIVTVVPALHAGGACALAAYREAEDPVMVEHVAASAGIDIGDTSIGMQVKFVQIPLRLSVKEIGGAHVTCLSSRPKLIGGKRAEYSLS